MCGSQRRLVRRGDCDGFGKIRSGHDLRFFVTTRRCDLTPLALPPDDADVVDVVVDIGVVIDVDVDLIGDIDDVNDADYRQLRCELFNDSKV